MVRVFFTTALLCSFAMANAQEPFDRSHYLSAQSSIAIGIPTYSHAEMNVYLHGDLEYFLNQHTSIRGESYLLMTGNDLSKQSHYFMISSFSGISYHPAKSRVDPYLCFQPGVSIYTYQTQALEGDLNKAKQLSPLIQPQLSLLTGMNLWVNRFLHFFIACRYVSSLGNSNEMTKDYNDFRISGGLGWNVCLSKKK